MKKIILDTNIIFKFPEVLSFEERNVEFIIPNNVLIELKASTKRRNSDFQRISDLVDEAIERKFVRVVDSSTIPIDQSILKFINKGIDYSDALTLNLLKSFTEKSPKNEKVILSTEDKKMVEVAESQNLQAVNINNLKIELEETQKNQELENKATKISKISKKFFILNVFIGIVISFSASIVIDNIDFFISKMYIWVTLTCLLISSVILYSFRSKLRLGYGIAEFLVGFYIGSRVFYPDFDLSKLTQDSYLQILGAVFIMIRGLDSINAGLGESSFFKGSKFEKIWRFLF
ncbi:hypothetical protein PAECIP111891_02164 [Paenibacillus allorhizoplanae]|uniref:PIN domain-containing protein n=1 Tax=Paenibacillus allorhizoplanae TaxID=2905648 RepID=A0ABN8GGX7_9BACL|nr:PIN domain-containing protein [Paenibacillus allorhizoplanae]CAH1202954.1 hypothetical protein PAECIP111891_02164 [Paenibacillus allorhizoplanae]